MSKRKAPKKTILTEFCEHADSKTKQAEQILNTVIRGTGSGVSQREAQLLAAANLYRDANIMTGKVLSELVARLGNDCIAIENGTDLSFQLKEAHLKIDFLQKTNESLAKACASQQKKLDALRVQERERNRGHVTPFPVCASPCNHTIFKP